MLHNYYQQSGGEDVVVAAERDLLRRAGHEVLEYAEDNRALDGMGRLLVASRTIWSTTSTVRLTELLRRMRPDIAHFHNTFALISPSAYYACAAASVPVVQTLHNYRLVCPAAQLYRDGRVCEACLDRLLPYPGVVHGCYRGSRLQTGVIAVMLTVHRSMRTFQRQVDVYIALTEFARATYVKGGLPADRILVKPNFVAPDYGPGTHRGGYALFVGRLVPEKGVETLVDAWRHPALTGTRLKIVGTGPLGRLATGSPDAIEWLGAQPRDRVIELMKDAAFLVFPSRWYEAFPMTLVEAFAAGLPVVAARLGAIAEIVRDQETGLHVVPGSADDLVARAAWAVRHPTELAGLGRRARREFEMKYTAECNYQRLLEIYGLAAERLRARARA